MTDATNPSAATAKRPASFWITLLVVAAAMCLYVVLVTRPTAGPPGDEDPAVGRRLEYLQLEGLTGGAHRVSLDDLQGRVTVLNYWGTWCPPCIQEFPDIVELAGEFAAHEDFRLYAVSCGQEEDSNLAELRDATEAFLESRGSKLPTYGDKNHESRTALVGLLGLPGMAYPTTLVLDRQGTIRGFWQGYRPRHKAEMSKLVTRLLAEPVSR
jgi:cytochrome c biogenesis protein CcmG, thiol:disulfide interchange protein DsbE